MSRHIGKLLGGNDALRLLALGGDGGGGEGAPGAGRGRAVGGLLALLACLGSVLVLVLSRFDLNDSLEVAHDLLCGILTISIFLSSS